MVVVSVSTPSRVRVSATAIALCLLVPVMSAAAAGDSDARADSTWVGEDVVVTSSRYGTDVHLSLTNISRQDILHQAPDMDIPLLLSDLPGVYAYSDGGVGMGATYLNIRGFDQRRVGVMINGIPLNDPEDHQVYWYDMPDLAASLQDIQVQRGVTNSIGGMPAIGGTVNLETRKLQREPGGRASVSSGSFGTAMQGVDYQTGLLGERFMSRFRVSHLETDGYRNHSSVDQWGVFWSGRRETDRSSTQINIYTGRVVSDLAYEPSAASVLEDDHRHNSITNEHDQDNFRQPHYEVHHELVLSDRATLKNAVFLIHGEGFYERLREGEGADEYSLDVLLGLDPEAEVDLVNRKWVRKDQLGWAPRLIVDHAGGTMILGGDCYTFHSNHWGEILSLDGRQLSDADETGLKYFAYTGDKDAWSVFVNERFALSGGLTLLVDLQYQHRRYDFMQKAVGSFSGDTRHAYTVDYDFFNPRGGLYWQSPLTPFGGQLGFYGHVGVAHREPTDADLFHVWQGPDDLGAEPAFGTSVVAGDADGEYLIWSNPDARAEKVVNYEVGTALRTDTVSLTVNGYWMDFRDEMVSTGEWDDENGRGIKRTVDKAVHRGVELGMRAKVASRHSISLAASRSWDRFVEAEYSEWEGNTISSFPVHLLSATWRVDFDDFDTAVKVRRVGRQYLDNLEDESHVLDGYTTVDLSLGADLADFGFAGVRVDLRLRNLLDESFETSGYWHAWDDEACLVPAAGRNFLVSAGYTF